MPTPHVFVVDQRTFPYHLRYLFAGTTPGDPQKAHHIGLLADISRVRSGDPVIFYMVGYGFYGIFCIATDAIYWEHPTTGWLQPEIGKPLIYRVRILPLRVYPKGVSEWEAIDKLPEKARDIRWSLIYRKLKGERGCSYIFQHEYVSLKNLLDAANEGNYLSDYDANAYHFYWQNGEIVLREGATPEYQGSKDPPRDVTDKASKIEAYLQAWVTQNIGRHQQVNKFCGHPDKIEWFANEVYYAGTGMQKWIYSAFSEMRATEESSEL